MYGHHPDPTVDAMVEADKTIRIQRNFKRSIIALIIGLVAGFFISIGIMHTIDESYMPDGFFSIIGMYALFTVFYGGWMIGGAISLVVRAHVFIISFNVIMIIILFLAFVAGGMFVGLPIAIFDIIRYFVWRSRTRKITYDTEL